jgi:hypothetical protein
MLTLGPLELNYIIIVPRISMGARADRCIASTPLGARVCHRETNSHAYPSFLIVGFVERDKVYVFAEPPELFVEILGIPIQDWLLSNENPVGEWCVTHS